MGHHAAADPPAPGPQLILMTLGVGGAPPGARLPVIGAPRRRLLIARSSQAVSQQRLPVRPADSAGGAHGSLDSVLIMFVSVWGRISLGFFGGGGVGGGG